MHCNVLHHHAVKIRSKQATSVDATKPKIEQQKNELSIVVESDAIVHPWTVVVKL
jgi:hypothetical protein